MPSSLCISIISSPPPFQIVASTCMRGKHECPALRPSGKTKTKPLRHCLCSKALQKSGWSWDFAESPFGSCVLTPWLAFLPWVPRILAQGMPMEKSELSQAIVSTMPVIRNVSSPLTTQGPCSRSRRAPPGTNILSQCTKHLQEENLKNTYARKN